MQTGNHTESKKEGATTPHPDLHMPSVSAGTLDTSSVYAVLGEWRERVGVKQFEKLTKVTSNTIYARRAYGLTYSFGELLAIGEKAGVIPQANSFEDRWGDPETQRVRATVIKESKERGRFMGAAELSILCELAGIRWIERELWKIRAEGFTKATAHDLVCYLPTSWSKCAPLCQQLSQRGVPAHILSKLEARWNKELGKKTPDATASDLLLDWQRGQGIQLRDIAEIVQGSNRAHELVWGVLHGKDAPLQVPFGRAACVLANSTSDLNQALLLKSQEHAAHLERIAARPDPIRTEGILWGLKGEELDRLVTALEDATSTSAVLKQIRGHGIAAAKVVLAEWVASRTHQPFRALFQKVVSSLDGEVHEGLDTIHVSYETFHQFLKGNQVPTYKAFELLARNGLSEVTGRRSIEWLEAAAQFARSQWSSPLAQALWVAHHRGYDTEGEFIRCEGLPKQSTYSAMRRVRDGGMVTDGELRSVSLILENKGWIAPLFLARLQEGQPFVAAASETLRRINLLGDTTLNNQQRHITLQSTKKVVNQALFDTTLSHESLNDLYLRKSKLVARSSGGNHPLPCSEMEVTENALAALMLKLPGITKVELEEALGQL